LRVVAEEKEGQTGRRFIILSLLFFPKHASVFVAAPQEILGENRTERRCGIGAERRAGTVGGLTGKK